MRELQIGGLVSFTTIDYPGKLAAVLFLVGCPLNCVYCSNRHLISPCDGEYDADKVLAWLHERVGKLEAVVFSGGEALMQQETTINYMRRIRDLGFCIGLHTNGFYPETLKKAEPFIDWIGLDFKTTKEKYTNLVGNSIAYNRMLESLDFWLSTGKDLEVRTTCDPRFVSKLDLYAITNILKERGVKKIALQKYVPHFEEGDSITSESERNQFFNDCELKEKINTMFDSVIWRE